MSEFKELEVSCPVCQAVKKINVPSRIFSQKKFGTIKVQVPAGAVCPEHQFIVFVDPKGIIRGYEKIDIFMAGISEVKKEVSEEKITLRKLLNVLGTYGFLSLIHAKLFDYPSYIIKTGDSKIDSGKSDTFFDKFLPSSLQGTTPIKNLEDINYDKIKIKEKNALIIDPPNILQTPWDHSSLKFEEELIKKALGIIDDEEQLIIIQQGIDSFLKEVEYVKTTLEAVEEIYMNDLIEKMSKDLRMAKINKYHFDLIKEYIQNRISSTLVKKIKNKVHEFLGLL